MEGLWFWLHIRDYGSRPALLMLVVWVAFAGSACLSTLFAPRASPLRLPLAAC
jgi:hypothetical protein